MTPEELDRARAGEAWRICNTKSFFEESPTIIAARLAREGWMPPPPVDPDVLAVRKVLARPEVGSSVNSKGYLAGEYDHERSFQMALAAYKAGKEAGK